jgi:hypothetical protein
MKAFGLGSRFFLKDSFWFIHFMRVCCSCGDQDTMKSQRVQRWPKLLVHLVSFAAQESV